ncbi:ERF family protein [Parabacteroides distasonis]|uniref:ERF family protein n=1 Tax=Parabacteroides distasonis TaxID=823 RepID=UPI0012B1744A|nr:ERF family protein [Parabacteroides distasonis]MRY41136.1 hypothetical protein [Parabacteroides distasonis]MRZ11319.1 hypothetical protein [Parabacteroides distasonis]
MDKSEEIDKLAIALAKFQGSLEQPSLNSEVKVRTKTGGEYKFKYADLSECKRAAKQPLADNELSVCQLIEDDYSIRTILLHSSGQWISSKVRMPSNTADAQSIGSAITYAKRYAFCAILGIVADDDEDANIASGNTAQKELPKELPKKTANSRVKKELTRDHLNNESAMKSISEWLYNKEKIAKEANQPFSVESVISNAYIIGKVEMDSFIEIYNNYKINNNLS